MFRYVKDVIAVPIFQTVIYDTRWLLSLKRN
jgi:hypothetical protein